MSGFDDYIDSVLQGFQQVAKDAFKGFEQEAGKDAQEFLDEIQRDLKRWTDLLAENQITKQDFADLLQAKETLIKMRRLKQEGILKAKLNKGRVELMDLLIKTAFSVFL